MKKILILVVLCGILVSCVAAVGPSKIESDYSSSYQYFIIDGMPCLYHRGSISCDWSRWQGHIVNGEIVVKNTEE